MGWDQERGSSYLRGCVCISLFILMLNGTEEISCQSRLCTYGKKCPAPVNWDTRKSERLRRPSSKQLSSRHLSWVSNELSWCGGRLYAYLLVFVWCKSSASCIFFTFVPLHAFTLHPSPRSRLKLVSQVLRYNPVKQLFLRCILLDSFVIENVR